MKDGELNLRAKDNQVDQERIMEIACDLCKWPGEYKDPDDLWNERCDRCTLMEYLEQEEEA